MLKMLEYYADNEEKAEFLQAAIKAHDSFFDRHLYAIEALDCNQNRWFKIGYTNSLWRRFVEYDYPAHFRHRGITHIVHIMTISFDCGGYSHKLAEQYIHSQLLKYKEMVKGRRSGGDWFTNRDAGVDADDFRSLVHFHLSTVLQSGFCYQPSGGISHLVGIRDFLPARQDLPLLLFEP